MNRMSRNRRRHTSPAQSLQDSQDSPQPPAAPEIAPVRILWPQDHVVGGRAGSGPTTSTSKWHLNAMPTGEALIRAFADERLNAGLTLTEINTCFWVETAVLPVVVEEPGRRQRLEMGIRIVERVDDEAKA